MYTKTLALFAAVASANAFAPSAFGVSRTMQLSAAMGQFDGQLFDYDAKKVVYGAWDPNAPRSATNFNPFETWDGNSPDASGFYPGEGRYKDPMRGDVSFAIMMVERADSEARDASPKPGNTPGCAGCRT